MDAKEFKRILTTFADEPVDVNLSKGKILFQVRDEVVEARLFVNEATLWVEESQDVEMAHKWLIKRLARLPQLAERILSHVPDEAHFVGPTGRLLDQLDSVDSDVPVPVSDAVGMASSILARRPGGTSTVLYLASDAGEGKTTAINQMARAQAAKYKKKETDWLLVPISLGGRPFLRLDDIIISSLVNRFRFPMMFYDSFLEMIKLGAIVPALDGFEEMFVESASGEAVSALGNLVDAMDSSGALLVAARKAFFEYHSLSTQGRFFDSLGSGTVSFARLDLARWSRHQFIEYCVNRKVATGEAIYDAVSSQVGPDHPLLTRAVLVRRVVDTASDMTQLENLISRVTESPEAYFQHFVSSIVEREANEKWIDRSGDPPTPLLTIAEHYELLAMLSQEMWENKVDTLSGDIVDTFAEIFCEKNQKGLSASRQVLERLKQHALIVTSGNAQKTFAFDHDEFRFYFLGEAIGRAVDSAPMSELRGLLRIAALPAMCLDVATHWLDYAGKNLAQCLLRLQEAASVEGATSFTRENSGALALRLLAKDSRLRRRLRGLAFPPDSLVARGLHDIEFVECRFQPTRLDGADADGVTFERCDFERLDVSECQSLSGVSFVESRVHRLTLAAEVDAFDPRAIRSQLRGLGADTTGAQEELPVELTLEPDLELTLKAIRCFLRATEVSEKSFRARLGKRASEFFDGILERLIRAEVVNEVQHHGSGVQRRFRLNVKMSRIDAAEAACDGTLDDLIARTRAPAR